MRDGTFREPWPRVAPAALIAICLWSAAAGCEGAGAGRAGLQSEARGGELDYRLPHDVSLPVDGSLEEKRRAFNVFSWESFVALNWPADPARNGEPDTLRHIGDGGPVVWETFKPAREIFLDPPVRPRPFDDPPEVPDACRDAMSGSGRVLDMVTKISPVLDQETQAMAGRTSWLIDQNGRRAHYEVLVNEREFSFIVDNEFFDSREQAKAERIEFPAGDNTTEEVGAVEVKSAWKVIGEGDDPGRFYVQEAYAYDPVRDQCTGPLEVGLVGLHIAHKTVTAPQWIWSTFEHASNAPTCRYESGGFQRCDPDFALDHYSFSDPSCPGCPRNLLPTEETRDDPVQVVRVIPIPDSTRKVNDDFRARLAGTVFENYELVDTQWPTRPSGSPRGDPTPITLANTTMETYFQGESPRSQSSSCIGCHYLAQTTRGSPDVKADFSFLLGHAFPHMAERAGETSPR